MGDVGKEIKRIERELAEGEARKVREGSELRSKYEQHFLNLPEDCLDIEMELCEMALTAIGRKLTRSREGYDTSTPDGKRNYLAQIYSVIHDISKKEEKKFALRESA